MRHEIKVYIASKLEHAGKLSIIRKDGFHINARWIDMAEIHRKKMKPVTHWQQENFDDIEAADFVILYVEPGDKMKGALGEIFYAVRAGKQVWIAGDGHGVEIPIPGAAPIGDDQAVMRVPHRDILPWALYKQSFHIVASLDEAFSAIHALMYPDDRITVSLSNKGDFSHGFHIFKDGNKWCAVGPQFRNLQEDRAGFGDTPAEARQEWWAANKDSHNFRQVVHAEPGLDKFTIHNEGE